MEIIIEADTVESAIYEGLKKSNKNRNDVRISVLEKGDKDFLGLTGSKKAKVRIEYEDSSRHPSTPTSAQAPAKTEERKQNRIERDEEKIKNPQETTPKDYSKNFKSSCRDANPEDIKLVEALLKEWFAFINFEDISFNTICDNGKMIVEILSHDSSLIIGKNGKTLNAFQLLLNTIINRSREDNDKIAVVIDTENYREKRVAALHKMADNYTSKLHRTKKDVYLPPLNNTERKIIHNYLSTVRGVSSLSVGEEPMRKVKLSFSKS